METKTCTKCGCEFPATLEFFYRDHKISSGLRSDCKKCTNISKRRYVAKNAEKEAEYKRQWRIKNAARLAESSRQYYAANREKYLEQFRRRHANNPEYMKQWRSENKEHVAQYGREWRDKHPDIHAERNRKWRAANPDKARAIKMRRRARKRASKGTHTAADIQRQYAAQKGKCYYCHISVSENYHVDHVIPLARGGSNGPENIVIACVACNQSKHDKLPSEWPQGNRLL